MNNIKQGTNNKIEMDRSLNFADIGGITPSHRYN